MQVVRLDVGSAFDTQRASFNTFSTGDGGAGSVAADHDLRRQGADEEAKVNAAVETLLVAELDGRGQRLGMNGTRNGKDFSSLRVCDLADEILAGRFKGKCVFDPGASAKVRETQRIACLNVWRAEHGQPALPPPDRRVESPPQATIQPLLHALAAATGEEERAAAVAAFPKLGLPALAPLRAFRTALPPDDPARTRLENLQRALACTVTEVTLEGVPDGGAAWPPAAREWSDALTNRPLTAETFVALAADAAGKIPAGASGFELSTVRDEDLTGWRLVLKLLTNRERDAAASSIRDGGARHAGRRQPVFAVGHGRHGSHARGEELPGLRPRGRPRARRADGPAVFAGGALRTEYQAGFAGFCRPRRAICGKQPPASGRKGRVDRSRTRGRWPRAGRGQRGGRVSSW